MSSWADIMAAQPNAAKKPVKPTSWADLLSGSRELIQDSKAHNATRDLNHGPRKPSDQAGPLSKKTTRKGPKKSKATSNPPPPVAAQREPRSYPTTGSRLPYDKRHHERRHIPFNRMEESRKVVLTFDPECETEEAIASSATSELDELQYTPTRTLSVASVIDTPSEDPWQCEVCSEEEEAQESEEGGSGQDLIALYDDEALSALIGKSTHDLRDKKYFSYQFSFVVKDEIFHGFPGLLDSEDFSDVTLIIGPEKHKVKAHKNILCQRSEYFRSKFMDDKSIDTLKLPGCHLETLKVLLHYIYTGEMRNSLHPGFMARLYVETRFLKILGLDSKLVRYFSGIIGGASWELPASYLVALLEGISVAIKDTNDWEGFRKIFEHAARKPEFEKWMEVDKFLKMLDGNPVIGRMLLQEHCRYHSSK